MRCLDQVLFNTACAVVGRVVSAASILLAHASEPIGPTGQNNVPRCGDTCMLLACTAPVVSLVQCMTVL